MLTMVLDDRNVAGHSLGGIASGRTSSCSSAGTSWANSDGTVREGVMLGMMVVVRMAHTAVIWLGDSSRGEGQKADRGSNWCHCVCWWYSRM